MSLSHAKRPQKEGSKFKVILIGLRNKFEQRLQKILTLIREDRKITATVVRTCVYTLFCSDKKVILMVNCNDNQVQIQKNQNHTDFQENQSVQPRKVSQLESISFKFCNFQLKVI